MARKRISEKLWARTNKGLDSLAMVGGIELDINNLLKILYIINPQLEKKYMSEYNAIATKYKYSDPPTYTVLNNMSKLIIELELFYQRLFEITKQAEEEYLIESSNYYKNTVRYRKQSTLKNKKCKCKK